VKEANRLREVREKRGYSGTKIAEVLGISAQYYYELEKGKKRINDRLLACLADFYGVSTDYLLGRTDDPRPVEEIKAETLAAHRTDDPLKELPEEARRSLEEFQEYILRKYGKNKD
jgi:transcriptional regulator with XRE-family HTH domain